MSYARYLESEHPIAMGESIGKMLDHLPCIQQAEDFHAERLRQKLLEVQLAQAKLKIAEKELADLRSMTRRQRVLAFLDTSKGQLEEMVKRMKAPGAVERLWTWRYWLDRAGGM